MGDRSFAVGDSTAAAADLTISTIIANGDASARAVTKSGSGSMVRSGMNSYPGITTISGGVLSVSYIGNGNGTGNIGAASAAENMINLAGTLQYTGGTASTDRLFRIGITNGALDASGTVAITFSNTGAIGTSSSNTARTFTLTGNNTDNNTLAPVISNVSVGNATTGDE